MYTTNNTTKFQELANAVIQWGIDRKICNLKPGATLFGQSEKLVEEATEVLTAVYGLATIEQLFDEYGENLPADDTPLQEKYAKFCNDFDDGIGDTLVVLILLCEMANTNLTTCLAKAYNEIKDRKGEMIDGKFVKEEDLK
jgi:hypothetical protein